MSKNFKRGEIFFKNYKTDSCALILKPQGSTFLRLYFFTHSAGSDCQRAGSNTGKKVFYYVCWQMLGLKRLSLISRMKQQENSKTKSQDPYENIHPDNGRNIILKAQEIIMGICWV